MKKRPAKSTLILFVIVVLTYFFIWIYPDRDGEMQSKVLKSLRAEVASFSLKNSQNAEVLLHKIDEKWYVSAEKYLADSSKVEKILKIFSETMELEMVSKSGVSGVFLRYDLDEKNRSMVHLMDGKGKLLRGVYIGKSANRYSSRYVAIDGDEKNIYATIRPHVGNITDDFSVVYFRDKSIISFDSSKMDWIGVSRKNEKKSQISTSFLKLFLKKSQSKGQQKSEKKSASDGEQQNYVDEKGIFYDSKKVSALVDKISTLKAIDFFAAKDHPELIRSRLISYRYRSGDQQKTVILYKKSEKGYPLMISSSKQGYFISFQDGDELSKGFAPHQIK